MGTFRTRREPGVSELRTMIPAQVDRRSDLDIEAPVFYNSGGGDPCYVPEREGSQLLPNTVILV